MNDNLNTKKSKSLEEEEKEKEKEKEEESENKVEPLQTFPYSEIIVKKIIDKLISLVITNSAKNKIEKKIPNYCFDELIQSIEVLLYLDLITYDKDDLEIKQKKNLKKFNSTVNLKHNDDMILNETFKSLGPNNSEIIRGYKYEKKLDIKNTNECSINLDVFNDSKYEKKENEKQEKENEKQEKEENIVLGFLVREQYQDKMTSFERQEEKKRKMLEKNNKKYNYNYFDDNKQIIKQLISSDIEPFQINPEEKIDIIKKVENHKIDFLSSHQNNKAKKKIPLDTNKDSNNYWSIINPPHAPPIDRDAGTKIKYEKPKNILSKRKSVADIPDNNIIKEEQHLPSKINDNNSSKKIKTIKFQKKKEDDNKKNQNKKKKYVQMEFESTDIDPKFFETYYETNETAELRSKLEQELKEKKIESERIAKKEREKLAKIEALEEMRKELSKKNVTVDVKGELVFIKPIDIKALNDEFKKGKSNFKNIKTIETETVNYIKNKKRFSVIKNPDMFVFDFKDEKNKKKLKKKREMFANKSSAHQSKKNEQQKSVFDKNSLKFAAGSNFRIMNPEVGVSIIEDKKVKSGGKDFFKKFNKCSLEIFQDQLSKTASSTFFPVITEQNENNNINEKTKKRASIFKPNVIKEIDPKLVERLPNEDNNILSLKTKNLKSALENLDLISEQKEKELNITNKKFINKNIIKHTRNKFEQIKYDYNEMNVFAKTLMGTRNWGLDVYTERKKDFIHKIPKKPEDNELQRELPANLLKHMPRKRLPPIVNALRNVMGQTTSGFFSERKPVKVKLSLDENKNNNTKEEKNN